MSFDFDKPSDEEMAKIKTASDKVVNFMRDLPNSMRTFKSGLDSVQSDCAQLEFESPVLDAIKQITEHQQKHTDIVLAAYKKTDVSARKANALSVIAVGIAALSLLTSDFIRPHVCSFLIWLGNVLS